MLHKSVLLKKSIEILHPESGKTYLDLTLGGGGHSAEILKRSDPDGAVIAFDKDKDAIARVNDSLKKDFPNRFFAVKSDYGQCANVLMDMKIDGVDGVIMDLGVSSFQIEDKKRGFSFLKDGPLDMRMDKDSPLSAYEVVNRWKENELYRIIKSYSEERFAGRIARSIVMHRSKKPIETTKELADIITDAVPSHFYKRIHPATKTFQAIRIAVNNELENLEKGLRGAVELLKKDGKICVISFHSLEDRIVKHTFRFYKDKGLLMLLNKKPLYADEDEIDRNIRARSAKMRCAVKLN